MRPESVPGLGQVLTPGSAVLLVPAQPSKVPAWQATTGKTEVAAYAAQSLRWPGGLSLVAWVSAASRAAVLSGYAEAASRLGLDDAGGAEAAAARFASWLRSTPRPWLVVLDGLRDPADLDGLWPEGASGRLLVTAADPEAGGGRLPVLPVGCLTPREAVSYLSDRLSTDPDDRSGQLDLALALNGEPAALTHASAVIETSSLTCRTYYEVFSRHRDRLELDTGGAVPAAAVTWALSAQHAEALEPGSGTWPLLVLAALLPPHGIPLAVLTAPAVCQYLGAEGGRAGAEQAQAAVWALGGAGLLDVDLAGAPPVARMSTALQASVLVAADPELARQAAEAAAGALLEAWPKDQPSTTLSALLRSCAESLLQSAGDALWAGGDCHRLLLTAGQSLDAAGLAGPAVAWWQRLTRDSARLLGERHPDTVVAAGMLTEALLAAGQAAGAVKWAEWLLEARAEVLGPEHRGTIAARIGFGRALTAAGRPQEAVAVLEETARVSERAWGRDDDATAAAAEEHAVALLAAGQPRDAVRLLKRALAALEKARGREDADVLAAGDRLAGAFLAAGQFRDAAAQYDKALARRERALGPDHPEVLAARRRLARACSAAGRLPAALQHYQQAAASSRQVLGAGHPDTLACQGELAGTLYELGHAGDAVTILRTAIDAAQDASAPGDPVARALQDQLDAMTNAMAAR
ncbi:MAG TPA: tetratricopeptide repeat protein [Trebonia sp.]|nr:tetratricopeptide repeat protein [Trebonia sp.]